VVTKATHAMRLLREETRAPVLPVIEVATEAEAVRLANDSPFGLSASVFTRDGKRAARVARALHVGAVLHDDVLFAGAVAELPFAGIKESGLGAAHGLQALEALTEVRAYHHEPFALPQPWIFNRGQRAFENGLRLGRALLGRSLPQRLSALWPSAKGDGWSQKK
jgi:succinate-semialdehyde dehydrogenase/glutarate-semialdehyde dehydrogenase